MHRRRVYLILGVVGVVLAGVLLVVFSREREPEYGGKRLSEWVMKLPDDAAEKAIRQIGTNALPYLLKWIGYAVPAWKGRLYEAVNPNLNSLNSEWGLYDKRDLRATQASSAFAFLGLQAQVVIPELTLMLNDSKKIANATAAASALVLLGPDGLPPVMAVLTNRQKPPVLRYFVAIEIGLWGTNTEQVVRVLKDLLIDSDSLVREGATNALGNIEHRARAGKVRVERESKIRLN